MSRRTNIFRRDKNKLEETGGKAVALYFNSIRRRIVASMRREGVGGNWLSVLETELDGVKDIVLDALVAGFLFGQLRQTKRLLSRIKKKGLILGYDEAVKYVQERSDLSKNDITILKQNFSDTAYNVTRIANEYVESSAKEISADIIKENMHVSQAVEYLHTNVSLGGGKVRQTPWLYETIVRTEIAKAYSAGRWNSIHDGAIWGMIWGFEYSAVGDARTRPAHLALDGMRAPKDDARWAELWPPNGFNCRCEILEIYMDEIEMQETTELKEGIEPEEGWNYNPGNVLTNKGLKVSMPTKPAIKYKDISPEK